MSIREKRKSQTRQALLQATLDLCIEKQAFASLSLRQVTKLAGVVPAAFYRHFDDMEDLGRCLVMDELGTALAQLRKHLQFGQKREHQQQIATSVILFFSTIDYHPKYWRFIVTERWGGSVAVRSALDEQLQLFVQALAQDLGVQPAFKHINETDRFMLAEIGTNLFFTWIMPWFDLEQDHSDTNVMAKQNELRQHCIRQAQLLFYGASNWQSKP